MGQEVLEEPKIEEIEQGIRYQGESIKSFLLQTIAEVDFAVPNKEDPRTYYATYIDLVQVGESSNYVYIIRYFNNDKKVCNRIEINFDRMTNIEVIY